MKWRRGDHTVDAGRGELLQLLSEAAGTPSFEVLSGELVLYPENDPPGVHLMLELYQERRLPDVAVIPYHRARMQIVSNLPTQDPIEMELISLTKVVRAETPSLPWSFWPLSAGREHLPTGPLIPADQLEIGGPARVTLTAKATPPSWVPSRYEHIGSWEVEVSLPVVDGGTARASAHLKGKNVRPPDPKADEDRRPKARATWRWPPRDLDEGNP